MVEFVVSYFPRRPLGTRIRATLGQGRSTVALIASACSSAVHTRAAAALTSVASRACSDRSAEVDDWRGPAGMAGNGATF